MNFFGSGDDYHPANNHVLPSLIRCFYEAAQTNSLSVTCWGTGSHLREFLYVDDPGEACIFALECCRPEPGELSYLNVGTGINLSIRELAESVASAVASQEEIFWAVSKLDGTPKKQLGVSGLAEFGWVSRISLKEGLKNTVALFRECLAAQLIRL